MQIIAILLLSIFGVYVSLKIRSEKAKGKNMVCPLDGNCEVVLTSRYAKFMGIPLEMAGLGYYIALLSLFITIWLNPFLTGTIVGLIAFSLTIFGVLFSLYLIFIEKFILKAWCTWCLYSAGVSFAIFLVAFFFFFGAFNLEQIANQNAWWLYLIDVVLIAIATSTAIVTEIITFRFLKDFKISNHESEILSILWQFLWVAIITVTALTFLFGFINSPDILISANRPLQIIVLILLSAISSWWLLPKLHNASQNTNCLNISKIASMRIFVITVGAMLVANWILLPATSITLFVLLNILLILISNFILFYFDKSRVKNFARS